MAQVLYIFRHGVTNWNQENRLQGHSDIPLNDMGKAQATQLKSFFESVPIAHVFSSDLIRAVQTASIALPHFEQIHKTTSLREILLGQVEGRKDAEVIAEYGTSFWETWQNMMPPDWEQKFPDGESKQQVVDRTLGFLRSELKSISHQHIAVAAHGMLIRCLVHALHPDRTSRADTPNCCVYRFTYDKDLDQFGIPELVFASDIR